MITISWRKKRNLYNSTWTSRTIERN